MGLLQVLRQAPGTDWSIVNAKEVATVQVR